MLGIYLERVGQVVQDAGGQASRGMFYGIAVALFVYGWLSVNIYLPILPQLAAVFHTSSVAARLTITVFLLGFALTQLVWGPLSDRFGRKLVLIAGLAVGVIGAMLAGTANNIYVFVAARFLESLGLGVAPVLGRSMLTDALDRAHVAIAMAYVAIVVAVVPAVAPIVGGYIDLFLSWRGIFFFLALYGAALLSVCVLLLPETNRNRSPGLRATEVISEMEEITGNLRYVGYLLAYGLAYGTLVGYYAAAPFIFVTDLGFSTRAYGFLLIFNVVFYVLGASVSRVAVPKLGPDRPIVFALAAYVLASVIFFVLDFITTMNTLSVLLPMSVFIFGTGMVSPAANAGAMTLFKDKAGAATAMIGASIAIGGAISSGALSAVHITRLAELGAYIGASTLLSFVTYVALLQRGGTDDVGRHV
jgi:MFS transporter, DHA1 family, multidrug resistance protein